MTEPNIETFLNTLAGEVTDARPLERRALRRVRTRRVSLVAATALCVLGLAVAGTGLALGAGGLGESGVTAPAATDPTPGPMPGTIVAQGRADDGREWWMSAYESDAGELCVALQHDTGRIVEKCDPYDEREGSAFYVDDAEPGRESAFGWVTEDTQALWVTWGNSPYEDAGPEDEMDEDESEDEGPAEETGDEGGSEPGNNVDVSIEGDDQLPLYDAPEGFQFPVKFYAVVPAPEDPRALRIEFKDGDMTLLVVSQPDPDPEPSGAPEGESGRRAVATGTHDGYEWTLFEKITDAGVRCLDLRWADDAPFGSGGGCSGAVPEDESFQYSMVASGDGGVAFFAAVAKKVESLEITTGDDRTVALEIIEGPEGSDVDYAIAWPPLEEDGPYEGTLRGYATARDGDGNVLDSMKLCTIGGGTTNSACGSDYRP